MHSKTEKLEAFSRLLDVVDMLRCNCPWDMKQNNESLCSNTIEEVYELVDVLLKGNTHEIKKELGDVLLHIIFYSRIGQEKEDFDIADICNTLCNKLIFRHPHIYSSSQVDNEEDVKKQWEEIKQKEKDGNETILSGVPNSLPSIIKAFRIQEKACAVGFDWEERSEVWEKVTEELLEVKEAIALQNAKEIENEFGDLLFAIINAARLYKVDPNNALERSNQKFTKRFNYIESQAKEQNKAIKELTLQEMEELWNEAKRKGL